MSEKIKIYLSKSREYNPADYHYIVNYLQTFFKDTITITEFTGTIYDPAKLRAADLVLFIPPKTEIINSGKISVGRGQFEEAVLLKATKTPKYVFDSLTKSFLKLDGFLQRHSSTDYKQWGYLLVNTDRFYTLPHIFSKYFSKLLSSIVIEDTPSFDLTDPLLFKDKNLNLNKIPLKNTQKDFKILLWNPSLKI